MFGSLLHVAAFGLIPMGENDPVTNLVYDAAGSLIEAAARPIGRGLAAGVMDVVGERIADASRNVFGAGPPDRTEIG